MKKKGNYPVINIYYQGKVLCRCKVSRNKTRKFCKGDGVRDVLVIVPKNNGGCAEATVD